MPCSNADTCPCAFLSLVMGGWHLVRFLGRLDETDVLLFSLLAGLVSLEPRAEGGAMVLAKAAKLVGIRTGHDEGAADGIANDGGQQILEDDVAQGQTGDLEEQSRRQKEEVGDGMLQTDGNEGADGEPDANELARQVGGGAG